MKIQDKGQREIKYDSASHQQILEALKSISEVEVVRLCFDTLEDRNHAFLPVVSANKPAYIDHANYCIRESAPFRYATNPASIFVRRTKDNPLRVLFNKIGLTDSPRQPRIEDLVTFLEQRIGVKPLETLTEDEVRQGGYVHPENSLPYPFLLYAEKVGEIKTENSIVSLDTNKIDPKYIDFGAPYKQGEGVYVEHIIKPLFVFCTDYRVRER